MEELLSFEDAYTQLESVVNALREGQLPLAQAMARYQEGVQLVQRCNDLLQNAQLTVQQLQQTSDGSLSLEPFDV